MREGRNEGFNSSSKTVARGFGAEKRGREGKAITGEMEGEGSEEGGGEMERDNTGFHELERD